MNILIIGAGSVGFNLVERLSKSKNHITIIDQNQDRCSRIESKLDAFAICGNATNPDVLERAGIKTTDMVIAVTPKDDTNIVCCNFAKQYGVSKRIARIVSSHYREPISLFDIGVTNVIEPEMEIVNSIVQYVELPGATEALNFQDESLLLRGYKIVEGMPIANKTLIEITKEYSTKNMLIVAIIRDGESVSPYGHEKIIPGDEIVSIMKSESLPLFKRMINLDNSRLEKVVVFGDGFTSVRLAKSLEPISDKVVLVVPDDTKASDIAMALDKTDVYVGDCTYVDVLNDVDIKSASFFIAASSDSEDNIMASLLAKAEGCREVIAVTSNSRHTRIFNTLGIDHIINPRKITMQKIIASIFKVPIGALLELKNSGIEVSRFIARAGSKIVDKPLHMIKGLSKKHFIIGAIFRDDEVIIPTGDTVIKANDEVLLISDKSELNLISKFFKSSVIIEF